MLVYEPQPFVPPPPPPPLPAGCDVAAAPEEFGDVVPVAGTDGLFGVAPAVGWFGDPAAAAGFGGFGVNDPVPSKPVIELSEPLFPDLLTKTNIVPQSYVDYSVASIKAKTEYEWVLTQHLWHLVWTNPGLEQFDTFKRFSLGLSLSRLTFLVRHCGR